MFQPFEARRQRKNREQKVSSKNSARPLTSQRLLKLLPGFPTSVSEKPAWETLNVFRFNATMIREAAERREGVGWGGELERRRELWKWDDKKHRKRLQERWKRESGSYILLCCAVRSGKSGTTSYRRNWVEIPACKTWVTKIQTIIFIGTHFFFSITQSAQSFADLSLIE